MTITLRQEHERLIAEALLAQNRAKIEEGYAAAQRGELIDADQIRARLQEKKRDWLAEQRQV